MDIVGIIPARGGSKGIKKKNIVSVLGEPLITHTIKQANESTILDDTFVSTDDEEIATVSRDAGAKVIKRPKELAGDKASTESALLHALSYLQKDGQDPDILVLLQCTSPLRRHEDIDNAIKLVKDSGYNSSLACCEDHKFYWKKVDGEAEPINYDPKSRKRRQDLRTRYQENGSIYVMETSILVEEESRLGGQIGLHEMPEILSFEIDVPEDINIITGIANETDYDLLLAG